MQHDPVEWNGEHIWGNHKGKGKGLKVFLLYSATTETVYEVWRYRNNKSFENIMNIENVKGIVIDTLNRGWRNHRNHITCIMVD